MARPYGKVPHFRTAFPEAALLSIYPAACSDRDRVSGQNGEDIVLETSNEKSMFAFPQKGSAVSDTIP
jgi:hypothetical protein